MQKSFAQTIIGLYEKAEAMKDAEAQVAEIAKLDAVWGNKAKVEAALNDGIQIDLPSAADRLEELDVERAAIETEQLSLQVPAEAEKRSRLTELVNDAHLSLANSSEAANQARMEYKQDTVGMTDALEEAAANGITFEEPVVPDPFADLAPTIVVEEDDQPELLPATPDLLSLNQKNSLVGAFEAMNATPTSFPRFRAAMNDARLNAPSFRRPEDALDWLEESFGDAVVFPPRRYEEEGDEDLPSWMQARSSSEAPADEDIQLDTAPDSPDGDEDEDEEVRVIVEEFFDGMTEAEVLAKWATEDDFVAANKPKWVPRGIWENLSKNSPVIDAYGKAATDSEE